MSLVNSVVAVLTFPIPFCLEVVLVGSWFDN